MPPWVGTGRGVPGAAHPWANGLDREAVYFVHSYAAATSPDTTPPRPTGSPQVLRHGRERLGQRARSFILRDRAPRARASFRTSLLDDLHDSAAIDVRDGGRGASTRGDYDRQTIMVTRPSRRSSATRGTGLRGSTSSISTPRGWAVTPSRRSSATSGRALAADPDGRRHPRGADKPRPCLAAGAERVVIGTLAIREPRGSPPASEVRADRLTLALDTRQDGVWRLPVKGWTEVDSRTLDDPLDLHEAAGLRHVLLHRHLPRRHVVGLQRRSLSLSPSASPASKSWPPAASAISRTSAPRSEVGASGAILGRALLGASNREAHAEPADHSLPRYCATGRS